MSVTVPAAPTLVELSDGVSSKLAKSDTWRNAFRLQNYAFAHSGARIPGPYLSSAATTTSGTLTQSNSTASQPDLDTWFPCSRLLRKCLVSSSDALAVEFQIFGNNVEAELELFRVDTGASVLTLTATQSGGTSDWASATGGITYSAGFEDLLIAYKIEFRATSGTASLYTWMAHETHLTAAGLPDGT